jgi:hypothetical protein
MIYLHPTRQVFDLLNTEGSGTPPTNCLIKLNFFFLTFKYACETWTIYKAAEKHI